MSRAAITCVLMALAFGLLGVGAGASETVPEACKGQVNIKGLPLADELDEAALKCDVAKADLLEARAEDYFNTREQNLVRIVDTSSPSGAAYIYGLSPRSNDRLALDVRSVPTDSGDGSVPICRLQIVLGEEISRALSVDMVNATSPDVPNYERREQKFRNPDGSFRVVLLVDAHDIITSVYTELGPRHFSRHSKSTDPVAQMNRQIFDIANHSDGWECN